MKKLISVASFTGLLTLAKMCSGFIIGKFVAVYVGPYGVAMIGQLQNLITILNGLINSPVGSGVVRYTAQNVNNGDHIAAQWWRASIAWVFLFFSILMLLAFLFSDHLSIVLFESNKYSNIILLCVVLLPLTAIGTMFSSILNGHQHYKKFIIIGLVSVTITTSVMVSLITLYRVEGALIALTLQTSVLGIITLALCRNEYWFKIIFFIGKIEKKCFFDISQYIIMAVSSSIFFPISIMLVRKMIITNVGWDSAGQWQAVWKISETYLSIITLSLSTYFLPRLSLLSHKEAVLTEIFKTLKFVIPFSILLALVIYLTRDFIVSILFTKEFNLAKEIIPYQLIGDCIKITAWVFAFPMLALGKTKWYIASEIVAAISFAGLSFILTSYIGINGVIISYIATYCIYLSFILINYKRIIN